MTRRKNKRQKKRKLIILAGISTCLLILLVAGGYIINSKIKSKASLTSGKIAEEPKETKTEVPSPVVKVEEPVKPAVIETPVVDNSKKELHSEIVISSVGDNTLGNDDKFTSSSSLPQVLKRNNNDYAYFFKNVADIFKDDDITTGNLETTFTDSAKKAEKEFAFKGPAAYAKSFPLGGIEGVNLSNNHIYDYLEKGFQDTLKALQAENVNYFGEGHQWITEVKGVKIGFLGYKGYWYDNNVLKKIKNDIASLKEQTAFVVINFHWGDENSYTPNGTQKYLAHYAIDQGADLIVGHHPHVIQGLEKYKGKMIAYSMGNFAFGGNYNPKDKDTFILQVKLNFTDNKLISYGVKAIPCSISSVSNLNDYCPTPLSGAAKDNVLKRLNDLSMNLDFKLSDSFTELEELK
jgi:hypothetical protein